MHRFDSLGVAGILIQPFQKRVAHSVSSIGGGPFAVFTQNPETIIYNDDSMLPNLIESDCTGNHTLRRNVRMLFVCHKKDICIDYKGQARSHATAPRCLRFIAAIVRAERSPI